MLAARSPQTATPPWIRGLIFTVLVPGTIALYIPHLLAEGLVAAGGLWQIGWLVSGVGALGYLWCFLHFLSSGGTPAIFFTRPVKFLIGEEPQRLVQGGLYRVSRNPMYVSVLLVIFGQALRFASAAIAEYGFMVWLGFHVVVVLLEEPHLHDERGPSYGEYCRRVPRWIGLWSVVTLVFVASVSPACASKLDAGRRDSSRRYMPHAPVKSISQSS